MDGGLLIRSERKGVGESGSNRDREREWRFFFFIILLNTAGSLQEDWPDLAVCYVGSGVMHLTRSVLTQTSLLSAT